MCMDGVPSPIPLPKRMQTLNLPKDLSHLNSLDKDTIAATGSSIPSTNKTPHFKLDDKDMRILTERAASKSIKMPKKRKFIGTPLMVYDIEREKEEANEESMLSTFKEDFWSEHGPDPG
ncbi:hypothetical protein AMTR_s00076p00191530 [Amborella trichopoda]|uniref:Uncharacterized protein n=1 Tax=Amborella trichopoda TaxID=13333 RepID=W1PAM4_AMBTC|nr:hypothetical protein AMTR_s00076p00191530 [Amborella trichopoda]